MPRQALTKTKPSETKPRSTVKIDQKQLPMQLLSPDQFEAITKANYYHPESQLIMKLFLHVNHFWHISRQMQGKPTPWAKPVDWERVEQNAANLIQETLTKLLVGVSVTPWEEAKSNGRTRK